MRGVLNDVVRRAIASGLVVAGKAFELDMARRIRGFRAEQARLKGRYGLDATVAIRPYDASTREAVEKFAAGVDAKFAFTSGSTKEPKKIAFTRGRLLKIKLGSFSVATRLLARHPDWHLGLFILAALREDDSLSSLIIDWREDVPWFSGLMMPAKYLADPAVGGLIPRYGATAVRLWLLILSNPAIIYSTNPSTLALFLTEVHQKWEASTRLVRDWVAGATFEPGVHRAARRLVSRGAEEALRRVAAARSPIPVADFVPGLATYICWDGGYVRPFLEQIEAHLPPSRFTRVPMYSMSTETVETLSHFDGDDVRFLPVAPGVAYEFIPEGLEDRVEHLVDAADLEVGQVYAMVVSDPYGLRRYQTDDLFACVARVGDAPDLRFLRRRGLAYSFTGEKLTDQHVGLAFEGLRDEFPELRTHGVQLTLIPSRPAAGLPGYRLVLAVPGEVGSFDLREMAATFDRHLGAANAELASKHRSGRLAPTVACVVAYDQLAARLDAKVQAEADVVFRRWDSQFKLLPLYTRLWEELPGG